MTQVILQRRRRRFERYLEIGKVLAKHGWESFLSRIGLADLFHLRARRRGISLGPVQIRETLEELGPTFIKLGQVLSTRADIVPPEYLAELEKLQDAAPEVPFSEIRRVIEEEFGAPLESIFASFDETALAAASLGQTHLTTLADGTPVVVKVQRPGIRRIIENDLEVIAGIARFLEQHIERARVYRLSDLVDEFSITIRQELDYTREGRNGDLLRRNLADIPYVRVAATIWDCSTPRVLTSERICGVKITDIEGIAAHGCDRREVASNLSRAFLKMIFVDGLFHGDPHPGNLVVLDNNVVGLLDYGMVGHLTSELKTCMTMLLANYLHEDSAGFSEVLLTVGTAPTDLDRKSFEREMDRLLRQYYGAPLHQIYMGEVLGRAIQISTKYRVSLPASLALLIKVILGVESIARLLDPDYDLAAEARPFVRRSIRSEFSLLRFGDQVLESLLSWKSLLLELPHRTSAVLSDMAEGAFKIGFKHEGLEGPIRDIDRSANRLSFALIASATIVASALILSAKVGPLWRGYPVLGLAGFGIAFVFAVWLMISIIRAGKLW